MGFGAAVKSNEILRLKVSRYDMVLDILLSGGSRPPPSYSAVLGALVSEFWASGSPLGMNAEFVLCARPGQLQAHNSQPRDVCGSEMWISLSINI